VSYLILEHLGIYPTLHSSIARQVLGVCHWNSEPLKLARKYGERPLSCLGRSM
jgi:hypothetical protein